MSRTFRQLIVEVNQAMIKAAIAEYGTTDYHGDAGFILPDGTLLDFSEGGGMGRTMDHRNVGQFMPDADERKMGGRTRQLADWMRMTGAIRWIPEAPGATLIVKPTSTQLRSMLRGWKESPRRHDGLTVDIWDKDAHNIVSDVFERPNLEELEAFIDEYM